MKGALRALLSLKALAYACPQNQQINGYLKEALFVGLSERQMLTSSNFVLTEYQFNCIVEG